MVRKTVEGHEKRYVHMRMRTLKRLAFVLISLPILGYLIASLMKAASVSGATGEGFKWWYPGTIFGVIIYIVLALGFIIIGCMEIED